MITSNTFITQRSVIQYLTYCLMSAERSKCTNNMTKVAAISHISESTSKTSQIGMFFSNTVNDEDTSLKL